MQRTFLDRIALTVVIIGAINWLMIGLFNIDLVAAAFGSVSFFTKTIYTIVGLGGLYTTSLLFRDVVPVRD